MVDLVGLVDRGVIPCLEKGSERYGMFGPKHSH